MGQKQSSQQDDSNKGCYFCSFPVEQKVFSSIRQFLKIINWKQYLKNECLDLEGSCSWAKLILKQYKKIKKSPKFVYVQQIQQISQEFSSVKPERASSYHSSLVNSYTFDEGTQTRLQLQKEHKIEKNQISQLVKQTDLMEDDLYEIMIPKKSIQVDRVSFHSQASKISNTPSHIFQEKYYLYSQIEQEPQLKSLILKQLLYYKKMTLNLGQQLNDNNHQLYQIWQFFNASFLQCELEINCAIFEMQQFIRVYQQCVIYYYDLQNLRAMTPLISNLMNDDNMLNFIVSLILENEPIYSQLFEILKQSQSSQIESLNNSMQILKNCPPSFFKIPEKLSLDLSTFIYINGTTTYVEIPPYFSCVEQLLLLRNQKSPTSKMKVLVKCQQKVISSIKRFYNRYGKQFNEIVDSDDLLRIQIEEISVHLILVQKLASNKLQQSIGGYYLVMLYSAIQQIQILANEMK